MREILFRGKSVIKNVWVFGYLICSQDKAWIADNYYGVHYEVIPETVGQYIGIEIKGQKCFDGDAIKCMGNAGNEIISIVKYDIHRRGMDSGFVTDIPGFAFMKGDYPSFPIVKNYAGKHDLEIMEIIGNIHDNPELLN